MPAPAEPNSSEVARRIGVSRAAVSRFRNGSRCPRVDTRLTIAKEYKWPIAKQAEAEAAGKWAAEFNRVLARRG